MLNHNFIIKTTGRPNSFHLTSLGWYAGNGAYFWFLECFVLGQHTDPGDLTEAIIPGQCSPCLWRGLWIGEGDPSVPVPSSPQWRPCSSTWGSAGRLTTAQPPYQCTRHMSLGAPVYPRGPGK